jgi:NarL family two-component system response regulator LiaR
MIRLMIVDDHAIVREGLRTLLEEAPDLEIVGEASDGPRAVEQALALKPDVMLLDLVLPGLNGIGVTQRVRQALPECRVLLLTSFAEDQNVVAAMQAGAAGYLLKDVLQGDLLNAIHQVMQGEPVLHPEAQRKLINHLTRPQPPAPAPSPAGRLADLTEREHDVLRLIAQGRSNREIADQLHITEGTVKGHVSNILSKLHLQDRTQAALFAVRSGLV